jgi:hypothetical protein
MSRKQVAVVIAAASLGVGGVGTSVAISSARSGGSAASQASARTPATVSAGEYATAFSALAGQASRAPGVDAVALARQRVDTGRFEQFAERMTGTRFGAVKVVRTFSNRSVLVAAGNDLVCVRDRTGGQGLGGGGGMGCAPTADAINPATPVVVRGQLDHDTFVVTALLPDGIKSLQVQTSDGSLVDVPTINNVASQTVKAQAQTLSWIDADGQQHSLDVSHDADPPTGR